MLYREISRILSFFLAGLAIPLLLPLIIALYCEWVVCSPHPASSPAFLYTILVTLGLAGIFRFLGRKSSSSLYRREAFLLLLLVYLLLSAVSALPFVFSRSLPRYVDAFFETVSGFTTTGASVIEGKRYKEGEEVPIEKVVLAGGKAKTYKYPGTIAPVAGKTGIEAMTPALLVWRSETQFLGGGGIVILFLALLPILGVGGKVLYQAEATGPSKETMAPRITETASWLWKIYVGMTLLQILLLMITNRKIPFLEAMAISFSTLSTGGFAPRNQNIASYDSPITDVIVMIFMLVGSINFSIYFFMMKGKFHRLKDRELSLFIGIVVVAALFAAFALSHKVIHALCEPDSSVNCSFGTALLYGAFQTISAQTSTGFSTANFDLWPSSVQILMLVLMFLGGMAGSTAGGMKIVRFQIFYRVVKDKIESIFRPDAVRSLRIGNKTIEEKVAVTTLCFLVVVVAFTVAGTFLLVLDGVDIETSFTTVAAMINNVGFAFRMGGPENSFAFLSTFGKVLCSVLMIAGRLEYFALLVVLVPAFWRGK